MDPAQVAISVGTPTVDLTAKHRSSRSSKKKSAEAMSAAKDDVPVVKIGFNMIAVNDIDDVKQSFSANFMLQVDYTPDPKNPDWRPWQQFKNAIEMETLENPGIPEDGFKIGQRRLNISHRNGTFSQALFLNEFPFDLQKLTVTMVFDPDKKIRLEKKPGMSIKANLEFDTLAEWDIVRVSDKVCKIWQPPTRLQVESGVAIDTCTRSGCGKPIEFHEACKKFRLRPPSTTISALAEDENEADGASKRTAKDLRICKCGFSEMGHEFWAWEKRVLPLAASHYEITKASRSLSAVGDAYYNMQFSVFASRKVKPVLQNVVMPSILLSVSSLVIFAIDPVTGVGERLSILFTIVLSLVTNQVRTRDRLPEIEFLTVVDEWVLLQQIVVYIIACAVVFVPMTCDPEIPSDAGDSCQTMDLVALSLSAGASVLSNVVYVMAAINRTRIRNTRIEQTKDMFRRQQASIEAESAK